MPDFALIWDADLAIGDMAIVDDDVASDAGLKTAVLLSLFLDRRANDDDRLPDNTGDRRGHWGDEFSSDENDRIGSRLWLLSRAKSLSDLPRLAQGYCSEALQWLLDDGVASRVDVSAELVNAALLITANIERPGRAPISFTFDHVWNAEVSLAV